MEFCVGRVGDRNYRAPVCEEYLFFTFLLLLVFDKHILHHDITGRWYISTNICCGFFCAKRS